MTGGRARAGRRGTRAGLRLLALLLLAPLIACATPEVAPPGPWAANGGGQPSLADESFTTRDGLVLPLRRWLPEAGAPRGVFLGLHGFNDYSKAFETPGEALAERGFAVYAYDQRGFGEAPHRGLWPGIETLVRDVADMAALLRKRYPETPLHLIGESMGGAILMAAAAGPEPLIFDRMILSSPAVWSRDTMPFYQTGILWLAIRTFPSLTVTGSGYKVQASDNIEMLIGLGRDPLFIKETRVDALYGLTNLMDQAYEAAGSLPGPTLLLYGERDQIVPKAPTMDVWRRLPSNGAAEGQRVALYEDGWHMLLRDLSGKQVLGDILAWIEDPDSPLPSGADANAVSYLARSAVIVPPEPIDR